MTRIVALTIVLITCLQIGECVAGCECFVVYAGAIVTGADSGCDHDGCGCCSVYHGSRLTVGINPDFLSEVLPSHPRRPVPAEIVRVLDHPPRF